MPKTLKFALAAALAAAALAAAPARAEEDWPQWRGPNRDDISPETGLLKEWPKEGPPLVWSINALGNGYSTISIKGDRIFTQGTQGDRSVLFCLSRADGKTLWVKDMGANLDQDQGRGPRGTPTIDGDLLYALSEDGSLACLKTADGAELWKMNILEKFKGQNNAWHVSESPLVDGDKLVVTPGGSNATVVALDKKTGATIWTSKGLSDGEAYSSLVAGDVGGVRAYMTLTAAAGVGVRASDGKPMWRYTTVANKTANIATPVFSGGKVFYSSAYDTGCGLLDLRERGGILEAQEVYFNKSLKNHHGGVILRDGYLFGFSDGILVCLKFDTGEEAWKDRSVGKGSLTYANGMLYILSEGNVMGLAEANPKAYVEKGRFRIEDQGRPSWAHPVVCAGKLYIRNQGILSCYNVKAK